MPPAGIRTRSPIKRAAADPRLRPRGHWDRQNFTENICTDTRVVHEHKRFIHHCHVGIS
jgi:hypothetical protein